MASHGIEGKRTDRSHGIEGKRTDRYGTIGYVSVSSREQGENTHAKEQQIARLLKEGCEVVFWDVESRYKGRMRLDSQQEVLKIVQEKRCDRVIVTRIDRLSRKNSRTFNIYDLFIESGVELKTLDEPIDLTTAAGKMVAGVIAVMAQHHSDQKAEAVKHGWKHLRSRKVAMNPPLGYVKVDDRYKLDHTPFLCLLETKEELSLYQIGRDLIECFSQGRSLRLALRLFNPKYGITTFAHNNQPGRSKGGRMVRGGLRFSPEGLRGWLLNPVLQGHTPYLRKNGKHGQINYDTHPSDRMISDAELKAIELILKENRQIRAFKSTALKYPLSGLVFCGECRAVHYSVSGAKNYHRAKRLGIAPTREYYFQCKNWRSRGCSQKTTIKMCDAEAAVIKALVDRAAEVANCTATQGPIDEPPELKRLREELSIYQSLPGNRAAEIISQLKDEIDAKSRSLKKGAAQPCDLELLQRVTSNPVFWETIEENEKRHIYRDLVECAVVLEGRVIEIRLRV